MSQEEIECVRRAIRLCAELSSCISQFPFVGEIRISSRNAMTRCRETFTWIEHVLEMAMDEKHQKEEEVKQ